eukprot:TRINITY_DN82331_c0_g1_i1.p1 TRINITY_DN82331_c0_g1~~TRINITY_DN82331_c0_g1_i1.p1  ORF type:complete len:452 (-),score=100.29 TRINITY_DN82331_c0_g1_i1:56-1411(-)
MRNIALLEWGPASLYYLQPRERIKVRTPWLEGGPIMPPFLSTMEEAKAQSSELQVRYVLSTFEDLNSVIRNLRRCFGFPYQEYIGYLNTLTRTHRARREHEVLIDRLRQWAIFGNVDAVVWIDYAKANQPPGSFKMGPRDSRPFSTAHMEICQAVTNLEPRNNDDESEAWSDVDDPDHMAQAGASGGAGAAVAAAAAPTAGAAPVATENASPPGTSRRNSRQLRPSLSGDLAKGAKKSITTFASGAQLGDSLRKSVVQASPHGTKRTSTLQEGDLGLQGEKRVAASVPEAVGASPRRPPEGERRSLLRTMLQEEFVPAPGSIYPRSISPGPGYYAMHPTLRTRCGRKFGGKVKGNIDTVVDAVKDLPGPGQYEDLKGFAKEQHAFGRFDKAEKMPDEALKKPFISIHHAAAEGFGSCGPAVFHSVNPQSIADTKAYQRFPKFSFGKLRRPF